jgi:predicted Zn-ribbon and HTH transcriptional regulator
MKSTKNDPAINGNMQFEVADIFRLYGEDYRQHNPLSYEQKKAMHHIEVCRTAELGGHVEQCDQCGFERIAYNSCRDRHCPKCQTLTKEQWLNDRKSELLPVVIFILFSLCHMILTPSYYATNRSPCESSLLLSVRPYRHLQKIPNGDLKANSVLFPFCIHGLRLLWTIFIFTA